ncbi:hypothetical protein [Parasphingorhabdus pacifica]
MAGMQMRYTSGVIRAGLFLLFVAALVLSPLQTSASSNILLRSTAEHKEEHRESAKLRERLPEVAQGRRARERRRPAQSAHPSVSQRDVVTADERTATRSEAERSTAQRRQNHARKRHSSSLLQVFRR